MRLDGRRTLAWRLARHALSPAVGSSVHDVVHRVVALRGWPIPPAELAVAVRRASPDPGELALALDRGEAIRSYAFRGGSYVMTHETAAAVLAVRGTTRVWESSRYQRQGSFELDDWGPWRAAVRDALANGPATRAEIWEHVRHDRALRHLEVGASGAGSDSLYKPLHWWGDICFGPDRDGSSTFCLLDGDPMWTGTLDVDDAGPRAVHDYLAAYGPATTANLRYWLTEGLSAPWRRVESWIAKLGPDVATVEVDGVEALVLARDLEGLSGCEPSDDVMLVPAFDPWVNGPGTADSRVVASARRGLATKGSNLVLLGGVVVGTWRATARQLLVAWFDEAGPALVERLEAGAIRVATALGRDLELGLAAATGPTPRLAEPS